MITRASALAALTSPSTTCRVGSKIDLGITRSLGPVLRLADGGTKARGLFVLDLDEIHAGGAEEFEVFVDGRLALVIGRVEMQEEGRRDVIRRRAAVDQVQYGIAFVHRHHPFQKEEFKILNADKYTGPCPGGRRVMLFRRFQRLKDFIGPEDAIAGIAGCLPEDSCLHPIFRYTRRRS